jgi:hypothetical protein
MTYEESSALMTDPVFRGRVKVACMKYADYVFSEAQSTPRHTSAIRWAQRVFQTPDQVAQEIQPPTVMDAAVQADGAAITDTALQSAVEAVVNKVI